MYLLSGFVVVVVVVVVVLWFYVPPTAKVIRRRDLGLKSHPKDCPSFRYILRSKYRNQR